MESKCTQLPHHRGEKCGFSVAPNLLCGSDAFHKVGVEDPTNGHNLTQYLCCKHFTAVMGFAAPCGV